ncbi:MAG TPA: hypothetical protein ENJ28_08585 [Gammaproteobacteria bacterium]|nr:hypothetical protein [Gammaproteobacteria bacterium]
MEIQEIKQCLTMAMVLHYYGLKPDKNLRLNCPFHDDKTPSLQVYYKTHTCYCFSTNCKTHGKAIDVIDFIMYMEGFDKLSHQAAKHKAILKAKELIRPGEVGQVNPGEATKKQSTEELSRSAVLTKMFTYFKNGVHNSKPAKEYLQKRCLDFTKTEVGYNSGQFHHGKRNNAISSQFVGNSQRFAKNCVPTPIKRALLPFSIAKWLSRRSILNALAANAPAV